MYDSLRHSSGKYTPTRVCDDVDTPMPVKNIDVHVDDSNVLKKRVKDYITNRIKIVDDNKNRNRLNKIIVDNNRYRYKMDKIYRNSKCMSSIYTDINEFIDSLNMIDNNNNSNDHNNMHDIHDHNKIDDTIRDSMVYKLQSDSKYNDILDSIIRQTIVRDIQHINPKNINEWREYIEYYTDSLVLDINTG